MNERDALTTREKIYSLGHDDPMVNHYLKAWEVGYFTYEQALQEIVLRLSQRNREVEEQLKKKFANRPTISIELY